MDKTIEQWTDSFGRNDHSVPITLHANKIDTQIRHTGTNVDVIAHCPILSLPVELATCAFHSEVIISIET